MVVTKDLVEAVIDNRLENREHYRIAENFRGRNIHEFRIF